MKDDQMKCSSLSRWLYVFYVAALALPAGPALHAGVYVSNLGNRFDPPGGPGIGDIHNVFPGAYSFTASFTTGNGAFTLNSLALEFFEDRSLFASNSWNNLDLRLYEVSNNQRVFRGELGSPTINPAPTQWPAGNGMYGGDYTTFVDFHPTGDVQLEPSTQYLLEISDPPESKSAAGLLFSVSSAYSTPTDWHIGPTLSGSPIGEGNGEFLKLAVDATEVPEPSSITLTLVSISALAVGMGRRTTKCGELGDDTGGSKRI